jgi:hypothetical protein
MVLAQTHASGYYSRQALRNLQRPLVALYYMRPILSGLVLNMFGKQAAGGWFAETAMGFSTLIREAGRAGLDCVWEGNDRQRPMIACVKR